MPTYIRCIDTTTGHEVDVDERSLRPGLNPIEGYPPNSGPGARPRPPKHRVAKDGKPTTPRRAAKATAKPAPTTPEGAQPS